ncbi:MAG: Crp/Fnr family transcriptional regulator [Limisphaerales bacterium]
MTSTLSHLRQAALLNTLRGCNLFRELPADDLERVASITRIRNLQPDEYLFHEGDPSSGFFIIQTGSVNVHRVNRAGKEQVIHLFRAGDSLAEGTLATGQGYPADARALEPTQVLHIQKTSFLEILRQQPNLALRMLGSMSLRLRTLVAQLEDLTLKDVETRLANWLLRHCHNPNSISPTQLQLKSTKRVLAAELGTVSETLSRTLAKFREQNLITVKGRTITILNPANLASLLQRQLSQ